VPNIRWLLAFITATHRWVYQKTGGRIGGWLPGGKRFLLLTTVGRKSGKRRVLPLLYVPDGDSYVVAASNAGDPKPPAWWLNLQAQSTARVRADTTELEVEARRAEGAELERLWEKLESVYSFYPDYRERAGRDIPVIVLEPTSGASAAGSGEAG